MSLSETKANQMICRMLNEKDFPQVTEFVKRYYSPRVSIFQTFQTNCKWRVDFCVARAKEAIHHQASYGIFDEDGNMVRLDMAILYKKDLLYKYPTVHGDEHPRSQALFRFLKCMHGDMCSILNTDSVLKIVMMTGHPDFHGKKLWKHFNIFERLESCALQRGCDYIVATAVSLYSQIVLQGAGFSTLREIKYSEYVDPLTGEKPDLELSPIHTNAKLMYRNVTEQRSHNSQFLH